MPVASKKIPSRWKRNDRNLTRAGYGEDAVNAGQAPSGDDAWTVVVDALTNIAHYLGSNKYSLDEIQGAFRLALDHYEVERTGQE